MTADHEHSPDTEISEFQPEICVRDAFRPEHIGPLPSVVDRKYAVGEPPDVNTAERMFMDDAYPSGFRVTAYHPDFTRLQQGIDEIVNSGDISIDGLIRRLRDHENQMRLVGKMIMTSGPQAWLISRQMSAERLDDQYQNSPYIVRSNGRMSEDATLRERGWTMVYRNSEEIEFISADEDGYMVLSLNMLAKIDPNIVRGALQSYYHDQYFAAGIRNAVRDLRMHGMDLKKHRHPLMEALAGRRIEHVYGDRADLINMLSWLHHLLGASQNDSPPVDMLRVLLQETRTLDMPGHPELSYSVRTDDILHHLVSCRGTDTTSKKQAEYLMQWLIRLRDISFGSSSASLHTQDREPFRIFEKERAWYPLLESRKKIKRSIDRMNRLFGAWSGREPWHRTADFMQIVEEKLPQVSGFFRNIALQTDQVGTLGIFNHQQPPFIRLVYALVSDPTSSKGLSDIRSMTNLAIDEHVQAGFSADLDTFITGDVTTREFADTVLLLAIQKAQDYCVRQAADTPNLREFAMSQYARLESMTGAVRAYWRGQSEGDIASDIEAITTAHRTYKKVMKHAGVSLRELEAASRMADTDDAKQAEIVLAVLLHLAHSENAVNLTSPVVHAALTTMFPWMTEQLLDWLNERGHVIIEIKNRYTVISQIKQALTLHS